MGAHTAQRLNTPVAPLGRPGKLYGIVPPGRTARGARLAEREPRGYHTWIAFALPPFRRRHHTGVCA